MMATALFVVKTYSTPVVVVAAPTRRLQSKVGWANTLGAPLIKTGPHGEALLVVPSCGNTNNEPEAFTAYPRPTG